MIESSHPSNVLPDFERDPQRASHFSPTLTAICLMVCLCGFALFLWNASFSEGFREPATASRDLERLASRMLGFESRLSELSAFEQTIFRVWGEDGATREQLRQWYAELPQEKRNPLDELYVGIFDGEANLSEDLRELMRGWSSEFAPFPTFRQILDVVYLEKDTVDVDYITLQARLAEEVPANWFYFQLAGRLASQSGNEALRESLHRQFQQFTDPQLWKWRMLAIFELSLGGIGFMCFVSVVVMWLKQRSVKNAERLGQRISPWTFQEGMAVLVRGGALSILLIALLSVVPYGVNILEDYGSLLLYLPTVGLAMVLLCRSQSQSFLEVIGCKHLSRGFTSSLPIIMSVIALGLAGDWLIMLGGETFGVSTHWTEWFLPQLVWGSQVEVLKTTIEVVVLAPIFEEIIFRGMVYSTLRAKFGFSVSMIGSAVIFALAHGYGPVAFLSVFWSGLLWAWMYERTGSVIPGICVHAVNNGLVVYFLVAMFR
jgi:hypothetical protein